MKKILLRPSQGSKTNLKILNSEIHRYRQNINKIIWVSRYLPADVPKNLSAVEFVSHLKLFSVIPWEVFVF